MVGTLDMLLLRVWEVGDSQFPLVQTRNMIDARMPSYMRKEVAVGAQNKLVPHLYCREKLTI